MTENPYQSPTAEIELPEQGYEYGGFWARFAAHLVDGVIFSIIIFPLLFSIYGPNYLFSDSLFAGFWDFVIQIVFPAVSIILFWRLRSATPGKMILNLEIVDVNTLKKPSTVQLVIRYFAYIISMLPLFLGFIWVGIDERKQGFHDKLAKTLVIIRK